MGLSEVDKTWRLIGIYSAIFALYVGVATVFYIR
jgi:hypothetical protein